MIPISLQLVLVINFILKYNKIFYSLIFYVTLIVFLFNNFSLHFPYKTFEINRKHLFSNTENINNIPITYFTNIGYTNTFPKIKNWSIYNSLEKAKSLSYKYSSDTCFKNNAFTKKATVKIDTRDNLLHTSYGSYWGMLELYNLTIAENNDSCFIIILSLKNDTDINLNYLINYEIIDKYTDWQNLENILLAKKLN